MNEQQIISLVEQTQADALNSRRSAAVRIREILLGIDEPGPKEAREILDGLKVLGIDHSDLPRVLTIVKGLDVCERTVGQESDWQTKWRLASDGLRSVDVWEESEHARIREEADAKRRPILNDQNVARANLDRAVRAKQWLGVIGKRWSDVVRGSPAESLEETASRMCNMPAPGC